MHEQDSTESQENAHPSWYGVCPDDLRSIDPNEPLVSLFAVDCFEISNIYFKASNDAAIALNSQAERAYAALGAICSFHFQPSKPAEPYIPLYHYGSHRSAQPSDFNGAIAAELAKTARRVSHLGARARIADVAWLLDRKCSDAGITAVDGYTQIIHGLIDGTSILRSKHDQHSFEAAAFLRRALQIGKGIGWDKATVLDARQLAETLTFSASAARNSNAFLAFSELNLDYDLSDPRLVAASAEMLIVGEDAHGAHELFHRAARAFRKAKNQTERDRCLREAAEALVGLADHNKNSAMNEAHWLEKALAELRNLQGTKSRIRELKHRLVDVQTNIIDEMKSISHSEDISEWIDYSRSLVKDKTFSECLLILAKATWSPDPAKIELEAAALIARSPFSAIVATTQIDSRGKPIHREPSGGTDDRGPIKKKVAENRSIRRSIVTDGRIDPIRQQIMEQHFIDEAAIQAICDHSPFVPDERVAMFTSGFVRFLQGDMLAALHIILPQLENSLRHIVRQHGHDVIKINQDMTQEEYGINNIFERLRPELDAIISPRIAADIESLFLYRGGPQLRDRLSHGLLSQWEPFGPDSVYACWLIFQLCCGPLLPHWHEIPALSERSDKSADCL